MKSSFSKLLLMVISVSFSNVCLADKGPMIPAIPTWAQDKVDCSHHAGLWPHKKVSKNDTVKQDQFLFSSYKAEVSKWLSLAIKRLNKGDVSSYVCYALEYAELASLTEEEVFVQGKNISLELIVYTQAVGFKNESVKWINLAEERKDSGDVSSELEYAKQAVKNFTEQLEKLNSN